MDLFGTAHDGRGWGVGGGVGTGRVIPYLEKAQKSLSSADISNFSPEIGNFCYIKKYKYRLHFNT